MASTNNTSDLIPALVKRIDGMNHNKKIKLRYKPTESKGYSLYLDLWFDGKRHYEFLKLYLVGDQKTVLQDKETLKLASAIRDKKEIELMEQHTGFELTSFKDKANFIEYFTNLAQKRSHHNWDSCLKHLTEFTGFSLPFKKIDRKFCGDFKEHLLTKVENNTAQSYFAKFKAALNAAVNDGIIKENPSAKVVIKKQDVTREFLTVEELQIAAAAPAADREVKNAFIFSCYTGLRISDIRQLTFERIQQGYLYFRQQKTDGVERMKLHSKALEILAEQKKFRQNAEDDQVFLLPLDSGTLNKVVRNWTKSAGIKKQITFHCARHTFATLCLTYDVDIYTVSKLLGHKDLKTTQIYAKLIDKKKDEAIEKLPTL